MHVWFLEPMWMINDNNSVKPYQQVYYDDVESARKSVISGSIWGFVEFEKNFTDMISLRYDNGIEMSSEEINESTITSTLDMSSNILKSGMKKLIFSH